MGADRGALARMGIGATATPTVALDFKGETLAMSEDLIDTNGIRGTRERSTARIRGNLQRVAGTVTFQPTPVELSSILAWAIQAASGMDYVPANNLPTRYVTVDRGNGVYTYAGCAVDALTVSGKTGEAIEVVLELVGTTETVAAAGTFPAGLVYDETTSPFIFSDESLTINNVAGIKIPEFEFKTMNMIDKERFFGSRTLVTTEPQDRQTTIKFRVPSGDHQALYGTGLTAAGVNVGVPAVFSLVNGGCSLVITMPSVTFPKKSPTVPGRSELFIPIEAMVTRSAPNSPSYTFTLDPIP